MTTRRIRVLFLCTHNSARSQMAEGLLRKYAGDRLEVYSAGTEPSQVHPLAVRAMQEIGIDISGARSKSVDEFLDQHFDYVITVCDRANETCPVFPGDPERIHWSFPDPSAVEGDEEERYRAFQQVCAELALRLRTWAQLPLSLRSAPATTPEGGGGMSRIAIFGDIHGNLPALESVLADIEQQPDVNDRYCLGDLVGYAPFPNEVTSCIRELGVPTIMGNYDDGTGFDRDDCGCAYKTPSDQQLGDQSFAWTKAHASDETKSFLRGLLPEIRVDVDGVRILLVHGSPRRLNEYLYEDRQASSFRRLAKLAAANVVVFGHTHIPYVKLVDGVLFVNAGSVGKPKDGDSRAGYVILSEDDGTVSVTVHRVAYDLALVTTAIRQSDLPDAFAAMLEAGRG